jgi:type IV pilus assembly protein PilW
MLSAAIANSSLDPAVSNTANTTVFNVGDYILMAQPQVAGRPCSRLRVTGTTNLGASITIQHATTDSANPPAATNIFPAASSPYSAGYDDSAEAPAVVINMGAMPQARYAVSSNSLTYQNLTVTGSTAINLASGVVALKAQYGISNAGSQQINAWVRATGATWATPSAANILRIKALRVAVVVRSSLLEKDNVTTTCTNNAGTNNGPCAWSDTAANPAPLIDLSADPNWQRYRYRVFETIIPLRNVIWANL